VQNHIEQDPLQIEPSGHNSWRVTNASGSVAAIKWSGDHQVVRDPHARQIGTLWRSDGQLVTAPRGQREIIYTWRAYLPDTWATPPRGSGPSQRVSGDEVARGVSHADAVAALLAAGRQ
jgi:hypothetical protein